ncbi:hypothetical protein B566_EDAN016068 [Ephemera danica]|nr:hypothetical protein B566_EDAN016068 [Ephemera danica]
MIKCLLYSEISLKILAHNNLIGRIIGKGGNTIKRIMQDTDTKITVSSINDITSFNLERIITVKGSIENMSKAEALISSKLRQSYENDLQAMAPQSLMFPGLHPMAMMSTVGMGFPRGSSYQPMYGSGPGNAAAPAAPPPYPSMYPQGGGGAGMGQPPPMGGPNDAQAWVVVGSTNENLPRQTSPSKREGAETAYLYIPNNAVGAIIGTKGTHIRNIIRFSGATVKIAALEQDKPLEQQTERKVTIVGTPDAQWKAQYLIFEKMRDEGFVPSTEDVRLTVELVVPSSQVGRIIGKGGQNVRELQRLTGGIIKLPEQASSAGEETTVHIIGPFLTVQLLCLLVPVCTATYPCHGDAVPAWLEHGKPRRRWRQTRRTQRTQERRWHGPRRRSVVIAHWKGGGGYTINYLYYKYQREEKNISSTTKRKNL